MSFICVIILASADFYTTKNISGRILVGLRWWSEIDEDGEEDWIFESVDDNHTGNSADSFIFWTSLIVSSIVWFFIVIKDLLSFEPFWMSACIICFLMNSLNLWGYYKCKKGNKLFPHSLEHRAKVQQFTVSTYSNIASKVFSTLVSGAGRLVKGK
jgi:hypothetical protein